VLMSFVLSIVFDENVFGNCLLLNFVSGIIISCNLQ
jgi:hypothetical protein